MSLYEEFKNRYESMQDKFDDLLDEAEAFDAWVEETRQGFLKASDPESQRWARRLESGPQRRELKNFIESLDGSAADALLRLYDRLNIIQSAEKGEHV
ncbi:MAG: hypothetical protein HOJ95_01495 [Nitrospinaceae bacterium]|nr:hypothetical protein [Nitrospinaceae bacterium]MBT3433562.1 hypothetical protein [Nitrospinaceae bacterium]MBT4092831.1 hypothetical protein [Nitrospinaceae bacterium]MBT5368163.1 hypothetical protein [Nitrospinaceae bacterium]MBT6393356.1 hypothetical protein [Nitrospinaceae bacterium]